MTLNKTLKRQSFAALLLALATNIGVGTMVSSFRLTFTGFLDQRAALRWVQHNIGAFGGDASNVVIWGESSGGTSVALHLVSPRSHRLFHKAILESPGITQVKGLADAELLVFEEVEFETSVRFEPIAVGKSLKECELQSGDIICFQLARPIFWALVVHPAPNDIAKGAVFFW